MVSMRLSFNSCLFKSSSHSDSDTFKIIEKTNAKYQLETKIKSGQSIVDARTLADQVKWVKQKFPRLAVQIEKTLGKHNGQYVLGKVHDHLIKIASGKAKPASSMNSSIKLS